MASFKNHTGETIGMLTFLEYLGADRNKKSLWRCKCSCGNVKEIVSAWVISGRVVSCGCYMKKRIIETKVTHRLSNRLCGINKLYNVWKSLRQRCLNPKNKDYKYYGGRGIMICEEWSDFSVFNEWAQSNGYREGLTIERNDPNLNYAPSNCGWASMHQQTRNKRNNVKITFNNQTKCLADWAKQFNIDPTYMGQKMKKMTFLQVISSEINKSKIEILS